MKINKVNPKYIEMSEIGINLLIITAQDLKDEELLETCIELNNLVESSIKRTKDNLTREFLMPISDPLCEYLIDKSKEYSHEIQDIEFKPDDFLNSYLYSLMNGEEAKSQILLLLIKERKSFYKNNFEEVYDTELTDYVVKHSFYDYGRDEHVYPEEEKWLYNDGSFEKISIKDTLTSKATSSLKLTQENK